MKRTRTVTALAATGAVLALAGPAQAAIVDQYVNEFTFTFGPIECADVTVSGVGDGRVEDTLKQRGPTGQFWSFQGVKLLKTPWRSVRRPVTKLAREGLQTDVVTKALLKRTPSAASRSRFGVSRKGCPAFPM